MAVMDEFREQREALKHGTPKQKIAYFWDYYKWHTIVIVAVIVITIAMIHNMVTKTDSVLTGVILNTYNYDTGSKEELINAFEKEQEIDTSEYHVELNTSYSYSTEDSTSSASSNYTALQAIMSQVATGTLDFMTGDMAAMVDFAYKGWFTDLTTILSDKQIAVYEPYFLYMDQAVIDQIEKASGNFEEMTTIEYPDPAKPQEMVQPIPVFLDMRECEELTDLYANEMDTLLLGILANSSNQEMTLKFIEFIKE